MFIIQAVIPATFVFIVFITAHLFVENEGSGIYLPDTNWDFDTEEVFPVPVEEIDPSLIDPETCLLYTSPSPRDRQKSRMPSSA